ncbi:MAG: hypothetical protein WC975_10655 [Phycisphaerae bacterium]
MLAWQLTFQVKNVLVLLITLIVITSAVWFYRRLRGSISPARLRMLLVLRISGVLILLILVFKPAIGFKTALVKESIPLILVDTSRSMQIDDLAGRGRLSFVKDLLAENTDLATQDPPARFFSFSDKLLPVPLDKVGHLQPEGQSTDIATAFKSLSSYLPLENIQALVLLTDGNHLSPENPVDAVSMINRPTHCLGIGSADSPGGLANLTIDLPDPPVKMTAQSQNPVSVGINWQGAEKGNYDLTITVGDKKASQKTVPISSPAGRRQMEVEIKPEALGKTVCRLQLAKLPQEFLLADNFREFHALALPEKIRILIVEGQIRPEFKFLKQYLQSDPAVTFASFVQVRPGKFLVTSQIPNYQPKNLPASQAEFEKFDLVILGDVSARTFTDQQGQWIKQLVESGRGLLVIPGEEIGELKKSVLADILPVRLESKIAWLDQPFIARMTIAGKIHPVLKNLEPFFQPDSSLAKDSRFHGFFSLGAPLPGTNVLLEHPNSTPDQVLPVLALRPVGKGKSALLATESTWHWALNSNPILQQKLYQPFWGQLIRDLANKDVTAEQKPVLVLNLDKNAVQTGEPVKIRCDLFDTAAKPVTTATISAELLKNEKIVNSISLNPQQDYYIGRMDIKEPGDYKIRAKGKLAAGVLIDTIALTVYKIDQELRQVGLNKSLLNELAAAGGTQKMNAPENLGQILRNLREQFAARAAQETNLSEFRTFDHRIFLLILFVALLSTEWFLRHHWRLR